LTNVRVQFDKDETASSLEPQLLKSNGRKVVNSILAKSYKTDGELLRYMRDNKTECALKFFETQTAWKVPEYIARAIAE
jgi:hypothetical protein